MTELKIPFQTKDERPPPPPTPLSYHHYDVCSSDSDSEDSTNFSEALIFDTQENLLEIEGQIVPSATVSPAGDLQAESGTSNPGSSKKEPSIKPLDSKDSPNKNTKPNCSKTSSNSSKSSDSFILEEYGKSLLRKYDNMSSQVGDIQHELLSQQNDLRDLQRQQETVPLLDSAEESGSSDEEEENATEGIGDVTEREDPEDTEQEEESEKDEDTAKDVPEGENQKDPTATAEPELNREVSESSSSYATRSGRTVKAPTRLQYDDIVNPK